MLPQNFSISSHFVLWEAASQTKYCFSPKTKHFSLSPSLDWLRHWLWKLITEPYYPVWVGASDSYSSVSELPGSLFWIDNPSLHYIDILYSTQNSNFFQLDQLLKCSRNWVLFFLLILATAIGGRPKLELCFLPGRLRWTLLPKERYGNSLSGYGSNT